MRPLEIALAAIALIALLVWAYAGVRGWRAWVLRLPLPVALAHVLLEGYRWQMVPLYGLAVLLFLRSVVRNGNPQPAAHGAISRLFVTLLCIVLGAVALAPPVLFPVPAMPPTTGPYKVGTRSFHVKDATRPEIYTVDPADTRELMVQVFYPVDASFAGDLPTNTFIDRLDIAGPAIAQRLQLPSFILGHLNLAKTNARLNAPLATGPQRLPVVLHSHGWTGFRTINQNQSEELASHGYVVVVPDHAYGAMISVFPDGRVANLKPEILADRTAEVFTSSFEQLVGVYAADLIFLLNELGRVDGGSSQFAMPELRGRLDLARTGLFGHSTGGAAVASVCARDARCKSGLGQDVAATGLTDRLLAQGLRQPFFAMFSEQWDGNPSYQRFAQMAGATRDARVQRVVVKGTRHYDFILIGLLTPITPQLGLRGSIDAKRGLRLFSDYVLVHFDETLRGNAGAIAALGPKYPEVEVR